MARNESVRVRAGRVTESGANQLQWIIRKLTGFAFGMTPTAGYNREKGTFEGFLMTLCGKYQGRRMVEKRRLSRTDRDVVDRIIRTWAMTSGRRDEKVTLIWRSV